MNIKPGGESGGKTFLHECESSTTRWKLLLGNQKTEIGNGLNRKSFSVWVDSLRKISVAEGMMLCVQETVEATESAVTSKVPARVQMMTLSAC